MRVHSRNRKEHVEGQVALNPNDKLLIVGLVDVPGQLVNLPEAQNRRAIEECRTERNRWKTRKWFRIPLTQTWNLWRWLTNRHKPVQVVSVVHRNLVDAVLEGARIQPVPGDAAQ